MSTELLNSKSRENDLLANQPFQIKGANGEIVTFGMDVASQIHEAYRLAAMQEHIFETYFDYKYTFEETANIARNVLDVMDDSHLTEEQAIDWALYEDEAAYLYEDAKALARYCVKGHGVDDTPSEHVTDTRRHFQFDTPEEMGNFNPFRIEIDGEEQEISYEEALRYYGAKKVDYYIREFVDTNAKYVGIFEEVAERIEESVSRIGDMNLVRAYVTELDCENDYIGIQLELENDEKDMWEVISLKGYFENGYPQLIKEDGTSFLDDINQMCPGMDFYVTHGRWAWETPEDEVTTEERGFVAFEANEKAKAAGVEGIFVPSHSYTYGCGFGDELKAYMNSIAACGHVYVAHHDGCQITKLSHIGPLGLINVNVYGHFVGKVDIKKEGYWHVDVCEDMFTNDLEFKSLEAFREYVEGLGL